MQNEELQNKELQEEKLQYEGSEWVIKKEFMVLFQFHCIDAFRNSID